MKETILLYNLTDAKTRNLIKGISVQLGIRIKTIEPSQYQIPLGLLAFGSKEDQRDYLIEESEANIGFEEPMLVFAGFTNRRLDQYLKLMAKNKVPRISLKAILTEHNAVWDSKALHDELVKEDAYMKSQNQANTNSEKNGSSDEG